MTTPLLDIEGLRVEARSEFETIRAVDDVDLRLDRGRVTGLIGESGSGKTTLVRSVIGLHQRNVSITAGRITLDGTVIYDRADGTDRQASVRGSRIGTVFQQPRGSLNPLKRVGAQLTEVLRTHCRDLDKQAIGQRARDTLARMDLDAERVMRSYPHQLSGGMCQRAAVAIAVATEPELLIADEATSALDVTSQASLVELLRELVSERSMSMLFVTHDVLLAAELCDELVVLRSGVAVERGATADLLADPQHDYTKNLIAAVPRWDVAAEEEPAT